MKLFLFFLPLIVAAAHDYQPYKIKHQLIIDRHGVGCYLNENFLRHLKFSEIRNVIEIGSRDGIDAIRLSEFFKAHVYSFECNPEAIRICKYNIKDNPNITLVEKAVWDESSIINFYPSDQKNIGASSCFRFIEEGDGVLCNSGLSQKKISVDSIRMDEWLSSNKDINLDLVCMDTQGATYKILKSFGEKLKDVKYIITEAEHIPLYQDEVLLPQIIEFMEEHDFRLAEKMTNQWFGDYLFINNRFQ